MNQHTLIWELNDRAGASVDCKAWRANGGVRVVVKPTGEPARTQSFAACEDAVRWAIDLERTLMSEAGRK